MTIYYHLPEHPDREGDLRMAIIGSRLDMSKRNDVLALMESMAYVWADVRMPVLKAMATKLGVNLSTRFTHDELIKRVVGHWAEKKAAEPQSYQIGDSVRAVKDCVWTTLRTTTTVQEVSSGERIRVQRIQVDEAVLSPNQIKKATPQP